MVPAHVIKELRDCFECSETWYVEDCFRAGTEVTVARGSFKGTNGVVVRVLSARRRVQVLLEFLGRRTLAEIDRDWLTTENRPLADLLPFLVAPRQAQAAACS